MSNSFFNEPILNSPYKIPTRYHPLDKNGQPLEGQPEDGRRKSEFLTPVPESRKSRRMGKVEQGDLGIDDTDQSTEVQKYNPNSLVNLIRTHVATWRDLRNPNDWGVTPVTQRLLTHWRHHNFEDIQPFFCQIEAVETAIWLSEVARNEKQYKAIWEHITGANKQANPEIIRMALKMATGTGKTTVMAMLIAWQAINAIRTPNSKKFSRGFLIIAPGITIRDRLRVLLPEDSESYYSSRELVPADMLRDLGQAKIVIQNYHAFQRRETVKMSKVGRAFVRGRDEPIDTRETEGKMLQRACGELLSIKNVVVINDEAHHCYREKPDTDEEGELSPEEKDEANKNNEAARLWISGIEALKKKVGVPAVYDLSATPFFLSGSGYAEGTLFPWTVSDFSLMDAIESGIVKLPRIPVDDNIPEADDPIYRDLWKHLKEQGYSMPKMGAKKSKNLDPHSLPSPIQTALNSLYDHYIKVDKEWRAAGIKTPPVFIVVCNNTSTSKLVYEWISGWARESEDFENDDWHQGHLEMFQNFDENGERLARPNTLLIDSVQLESGEALDKDFRKFAAPEIDKFKQEMLERGASQKEVENITDQELLREVMNTVGKPGKLGADIRCVVSVSMLTEGWDTNTVTHILGLRAFGTQLLCEQVVGRALRRLSYDLNDKGLFGEEYADILGIPFDFTANPVVAKPTKPKPITRVHALKEREALTITFPRVTGYRKDFRDERIRAEFTEDSRLEINPLMVGATRTVLAGIVGEDIEIGPDYMREMRTSEISYNLAKILFFSRYKKVNEPAPMHLFPSLQQVVRRWLDEDYLTCTGPSIYRGMVLYRDIANRAVELIDAACQRKMGDDKSIKALIDPYNPHGSTRHVAFNTTKDLFHETRKSHVNLVVCDSSWERELARVLESHPKVISYVKNQGLQFEVPYSDGTSNRKYIPDFIVQVDDGYEDPLNLVVEVKGRRGVDEQIKAETMHTKWIPGVNALGTFGRWGFLELRDVFEMESELGEKIEREFGQHMDEVLNKNAQAGETV